MWEWESAHGARSIPVCVASCCGLWVLDVLLVLSVLAVFIDVSLAVVGRAAFCACWAAEGVGGVGGGAVVVASLRC